MAGFAKSLLFAALCFAVAESTVLEHLKKVFVAKRESPPEPDYFNCWHRREACANGLQHYEQTFSDLDSGKAFLSDASNVAQMCDDLDRLRRCWRNVVQEDGCEPPTPNSGEIYFNLVVDYICREQSQTLIAEAASESQCLESEEAVMSLVLSVQPCVMNIMGIVDPSDVSGGEEVCNQVVNFVQCGLGAIRDSCGPETYALAVDLIVFLIDNDFPQQVWAFEGHGPADFSCLAHDYPVPPTHLARRSMGLMNFLKR